MKFEEMVLFVGSYTRTNHIKILEIKQLSVKEPWENNLYMKIVIKRSQH